MKTIHGGFAIAIPLVVFEILVLPCESKPLCVCVCVCACVYVCVCVFLCLCWSHQWVLGSAVDPSSNAAAGCGV